jgi:hypothetical protein
MARDIFRRLEDRATGGHPDHGTPDPIFREAADAILLLRADLGKLASAAAKVMQTNQNGYALGAALRYHNRGLADTDSEVQSGRGIQRPGEGAGASAGAPCERPAGLCEADGVAERPRPTNGLWRDADWLGCRDGKWRPVEPGTFPLAHAGTFRNRVAELRGAGNAINLAQAEGFIEAVDFALGRAGVAP